MDNNGNNNGNFFSLLLAGGIAYFIMNMFKGTKQPDAYIEQGWQISPYAKLDAARASQLAYKIKEAIGYVSTDWDAIATQFEKLANKYDVEVLYKAFGVWDGPYTWNGDLFTVLNKVYDGTTHFGDKQDLSSIKAHCYEYSSNVKW